MTDLTLLLIFFAIISGIIVVVLLTRPRRGNLRILPTYKNLIAAAHAYYRALALLETGVNDRETVHNAELGMQKVEVDTNFVDKKFSDAWYKFWQTARYTDEYSRIVLQHPEKRKQFWQKQCKQLANELGAMRSAVKEKS